MSVFRPFLFLAATCTLLHSCFKDEPLNAECDITEATLHTSHPETWFEPLSDSTVHVLYNSHNIVFNVRHGAPLNALAPTFTLTPGATISPANGSANDFSQGPKVYRVTSEDGAWSRDYTVSFVPRASTQRDTVEFDFENFALHESGKYYIWTEQGEDGTPLPKSWVTGNPGFYFAFTLMNDPMAYPTTPLEDGLKGYGVRLETRSTGSFGTIGNRRIAAGNLFLGEFDTQYVLTETMKSTRFGIPFDRKPLRLTGYYQYQPGANYQDGAGNFYPEKTDSATVYAVFYRNHDDRGTPVVLYGDNVQTSGLIVGKAIVKGLHATKEWTPFECDFTYTGETAPDLLSSHGYSLTVVFSSSHNGDRFEGAVGSQLLIDQVRVICDKKQSQQEKQP